MNENQKNEINEVQPSSLRHIVGQHGVKNLISVAIDSSQMDSVTFPHALMVGGPGLGKTAIAQVLAAELAADFSRSWGNPSSIRLISTACCWRQRRDRSFSLTRHTS